MTIFIANSHVPPLPNFFLRPSRIRVDQASYESKTIDKRGQYDWRVEKNLDGSSTTYYRVTTRHSLIALDNYHVYTIHFAGRV